jgi:AcrR family transcriptional regulator
VQDGVLDDWMSMPTDAVGVTPRGAGVAKSWHCARVGPARRPDLRKASVKLVAAPLGRSEPGPAPRRHGGSAGWGTIIRLMSPSSADEPTTELLSVREEQRLMTRRRIVQAARRVFEERGYGQASIGDITKAAKVNRATFYLHFANKAAVFNDVYAEVREHQTGRYWAMLDEGLTAGTEEALRDVLDRALAWWEEQAALLPAIHEAMASDLEVAARWKDQLDELAGELRGYLGQFPEEERDARRLRVQLMVMQLDQLCFRAIVQKVFVIERDVLLDIVCDLWLDALHLNRGAQQ